MNKKLLLFLFVCVLSVTSVFGALSDGLFTYFTFDSVDTSGTTLINKVGGANATCVNMASGCNTALGLLINSSNFDGTNDEIDTNINVASGNYSMSFWLNMDTIINGDRVLSDETGSSGTFVHFTASSTLNYCTRTSTAYCVASNSTIPTGQWVHIVVTRNDSLNSIYINGSISNNLPSALYTDSIYSLNLMNGSGTWSDGRMDEFAYYNRTLSPSEVSQLYNGGLGLSYSLFASNSATINQVSVQNTAMSNNSNIWVNIGKVNVSVNASTTGSATYTLNATTFFTSPVGQILNTTTTSNLSFRGYFGLNLGTGNLNETATNIGEIGAEGIRYINFTARAGTNTTSLFNISIGFDYTKPNITYTAPLTSNSFQINATNYFTYSDALSGVSACWVQWVNNNSLVLTNTSCSASTLFTQYGYYNMTIYVRDNAGNSQIVSNYFLLNANNVVTFKDATTQSPLTNKTIIVGAPNGDLIYYATNNSGSIVFTTIINETQIEGQYNLTYIAQSGYVTPITFSVNLNTSTIPINNVYNISRTTITIKLYDRETRNLINKSANVVILDLLNTTTSNGTVIIQNISIQADDYSVYGAISGYVLTQKTFTYTSQEAVTVNLYLMNATSPNVGNLFVNIFDPSYNSIKDANVLLEEYDVLNNGFVEVQQCNSDSNGECVFSIELGQKIYRVYATKLIDGVMLESYSSFAGSPYSVDNTLISIYLQSVEGFDVSDYYSLNVEVYNKTLVGNTSYLYATFNDASNIVHDMCIEYYAYVNNVRVSIYSTCTVGSSGTVSFPTGKVLDRDYTTYVRIYENTTILTYYEDVYVGRNSFAVVFENYISIFVIAMLSIILSLGLWAKNIPLVGVGFIIMSILIGANDFGVQTGVRQAVIIVFSSLLIWISGKVNDNDAH